MEENELIKNIEKNKNSQQGGLEQHEHGYCHHHSGEHRHHHSSHRHHRHHRRLFRRIRKIFREISKSRKWQTSFACIAICLCVVACLVMKHESSKRNIEIERIQAEYQEQQAKSSQVNAVIQEYMPGIVCWGDSLTYGGYPEELSKMLDSKLEDIQENSNITLSMQRIRVFNEGVQGETSGEITARSGAVPYVLKRAVNLPADCAEVSIQLGIEGTDNSGKSVAFYNNETYRVILGNIRGYMNVGIRQMDGYSYFYHTFTRASEGEVMTLPVGTKMYVEGRRDYSGNIPVIFMGENGGWDSDPAVLIDQVNRIVEHTQNNHGRYIVIGLHTGTPEERRELEDAMTAAFGEQYINLREYMCTTGIEDIGMVPTAEDRVDMEQGIAPKSLLKDDLHFTDVGNRVVATAVINRMEELGYFQEIIAAVKEE